MEVNIISMKVTFTDIYKWGEGWTNVMRNKWTDYLKNMDTNFWHFVEVDDFNKSQYLVTTGGSVYLHPMGFTMCLREIGSSYSFDDNGNKIEYYPTIDELKEICNGLMEVCGGKVEYGEIKVNKINI